MGLFKKNKPEQQVKSDEKSETKKSWFCFGRKKQTETAPPTVTTNTEPVVIIESSNEPQIIHKKSGCFASIKAKQAPPDTTLNDALNYIAPKKTPSILPGSEGEHALQEKFGAKQRAMNFYNKQVLNFLVPEMQKFIE